MKIEISSFADKGVIQNERLVIKLLDDLDIGEYAVFCSSSTDGSPLSGKSTAFWFPDESLQRGDLVVLYTKSGSTRKKELGSGGTAHFFYWGLDAPVWTGQNGAVLLEVKEWSYRLSK